MRRACLLCFAFASALTTAASGAEPETASEPGATKPPGTAADAASVDLGVSLGAGARLGDSPAYDITGRAGVAFGGFAWLLPSPVFAVGLAYQHLGLGREEAGLGPFGAVDVDRSAHLLWLGLRLFPLRGEDGALFVEIAPGLAFQHAAASGVLGSGGPSVEIQPFTCKATDSAALGLRAGIGGDLDMGDHLHTTLGATFDNLHLSSNPLGDCVFGSGTVTELMATLTLSYRIDVTPLLR